MGRQVATRPDRAVAGARGGSTVGRATAKADDAGQWLLVRTAFPWHVTALSGIGRQFDPGGRAPAAIPLPVGWID